jgi:hypothetical protein
MIYCSTCGKGIPDDSRFCTFCGSTVPVVDPDKPDVAKPSPASTPASRNTRVENRHYTKESTVAVRGPMFYENPGFYGAILLGVGFFLPWITAKGQTFSAFDLLKSYVQDKNYLMVTLFVLIPVGALIVFIQCLTNALPGAISGLFKWLSFLCFAILVVLLFKGIYDLEPNNNWAGIDTTTFDIGGLFKLIAIGLWLSLIGVLLMLFNKSYHRPRVVREV